MGGVGRAAAHEQVDVVRLDGKLDDSPVMLTSDLAYERTETVSNWAVQTRW